ncbi:uncharacterized protein [Typha latifolia]|uniref:uncharacterized protein n=1 Tax=Typha latifolia TaxID=4733 RepID=UPI003C2DC056
MDPIKIEKFQVMKRYKRRKQFLPTLVKYLVVAILLGLFLSTPIWVPLVSSSLKLFFLVSLPNMVASLFEPKCLFILCNLIVLFLVGESKLSRSSSAPDIYEEYMRRNKSKRESEVFKDLCEGGGGGGGEEEEERGGEGEEEMDMVELNKRVEDFIARVNKQRRNEARMMLCYE